jgi:polysaccharide biosynthesis transport protein
MACCLQRLLGSKARAGEGAPFLILTPNVAHLPSEASLNSHLRPVPDSVPLEERAPVWQQEEPDVSDDLKGVMQALRKHYWRFVVMFLIVVALTGAFWYVSVPAYSGIATVIIDPRKEVVTNSPEVLPNVADDSPVIDTQVQLIQSRVVIGQVVDSLLAADPHLRIAEPRRVIWQKRDDMPLPASGDSSARDALIDVILAQLDVERVAITSALTIEYRNEDPELAARIANGISNGYVGYQSNLKLRANRDANQWLQQRVAELKSQWDAAQAQLDAYRSRSGLIQAKGATSTESQLTSFDTALTEAEQALSEAQSKLTAYRGALETAGAAEAANVVSTPGMLQLRTQYVTLLDQKAQLSSTMGPNYPQMVELNQQISGLKEQMSVEANRTLGELKNDVVVAQSKMQSLRLIRDESRKQMVTDNAASVKLTQLQSEADSLKQMYGDMLTRFQQVTAQGSAGEVNATVVSPATVSQTPSYPKMKLLVAAAIGGGISLGAFGVMLAHLFDGVLLRPKALEQKTGMPILALVPRLRSADLRIGRKRVPITEIIVEKPLSMFAESFRNLRIAVQQTAGTRQSVVVQITSGSFGEGKTVSSMAFAQAAAMDGRRVLLIDADVRTRSLTRLLQIDAPVGLLELLRGKVQLRDVVIPGNANRRPHVLPLSNVDVGPHDRFSSETFEGMLEAVKRGFDLIVIDSAPVLAVADSLALTRRVDVVVMVALWAKTPVEIITKGLSEIDRAGGRVAGILLTQVDVKKVTNQQFGRGYYPTMLKYYRQ